MNKIQVLVVEDNPIHQEHLYVLLDGSRYEIIAFESKVSAVIPSILRIKPDVVLMDIDLGTGDDGILLTNKINKLCPTPIIFTTARKDTLSMVSAAKQLPVAYLVKPINLENLQAAIELAIYKSSDSSQSDEDDFVHQKNNNCVFVKIGAELTKLNFSDILGFEVAKNRYLNVITTEEKYLIRSSISSMLRKMPDDFIQSHRTAIVNIKLIKAINDFEGTVIVGNKSFPLGNTYKEQILTKFKIL